MWYRNVIAAMVAVAIVSAPAVARAGGTWPWPVGSAISLGYGATYTASDGRACTHGGVDIPADPGAQVHACAAGKVTFAGPVPAGEGAQAIAVTILTDDGLHVTYLPLERAGVRAGAQIAAGDILGPLAASGDASGGQPHLHLGVKRGDRQLDPAGFLAPAAPAASAPAPSPAPAPAPAAKPAPATPPAHVTVPVAGTAASPARTPATSRQAPTEAGVPAVAAKPFAAPRTVSLRRGQTLGIATQAGAPASSGSTASAARGAAVSRPGTAIGDVLSAATRARNSVASWVLRAMIAAAAIACTLVVLRSVGSRAGVAEPQRVRA